MTRSIIAALALTLAVAPVARAQAGASDQAATRAAIVVEMVSQAENAIKLNPGGARPFQTPIGAGGEGHILTYLISVNSERAGYAALLTLMEARVDKQIGATPSASGSTSLAMKGLVPELLGIAVENGALNKEVKDTTLTFRATPMGGIKALQGHGLLDTYADYSKSAGARFASRFSAAASFDTSLGSSAGSFTADDQQLTTWSVRYEVFNGRNPAAPQYTDLWKTLAASSAPYSKAAAAINAAMNNGCPLPPTPGVPPGGPPKWPEFCKWQTDLVADVDQNVDMPWQKDKDTAAAAARFKAILDAAMPKLETLPNMPDAVKKALDTYVTELTGIQKGIDKIYDFAGKGPLVTFDWSTARDASLPDLYTATGIFEAALGATRKTDLTINAAASFFRTQPQNATHTFKSFDLTAQIEHPMGSVFVLPSVTAAFSARYSYLPNETVASTGVTSPAATSGATASGVAPQGNIVVVQAKATIPIKGSGIKVPLSVTASNRTELIKEADVRGSFGITFDLDTFVTVLSSRGK